MCLCTCVGLPSSFWPLMDGKSLCSCTPRVFSNGAHTQEENLYLWITTSPVTLHYGTFPAYVCVCLLACAFEFAQGCSLCICSWWTTTICPPPPHPHTPSQILAGHWLTVAPGDDSAGHDWQKILTQSDSLLVQSDWSISNITYSSITGEKTRKRGEVSVVIVASSFFFFKVDSKCSFK